MDTRIGRDVLPSHLSVGQTPAFSNGNVFDNLRLRIGEVKGVVYPDEAGSLSKKFVEYSVYVQHRSDNGTAVGKMYYHCALMNSLAGLADQVQYALRADPGEKKTTNSLGQGSKVLLLCVNGETSNAVIVGGLRDSQDEEGFDGIAAKDLGTYYHWVFNGARIDVNKDGELILTYTGKTTIDGKTDSSVQSSNAGGTVALTKDGTLALKPPQGVKTGSASDHTLLGESFRNAQQQQDNTLVTQFKAAQTAVQTAATALNTAGTSMAVPITGAVAAGPQILAAGAALQLVAQALGALGQAIQQFEQGASQKNGFLSKNNQSD